MIRTTKTKNFIGTILFDVKQNPFKVLIAILACVIFDILWGYISAIFLGTFVLFILLKWDSRVFIAIGLLFLISCPLYLLQRKELMAEEMAVYAYYALFLGVMLQLIEYWRESHSFSSCLRLIKKARKQ